ncbi:MAG: polysaccharide deacetylase family protein [Nevskiaceae bacterium]|nr:polysaccharide deacetylase family protein [Nevskiaceae bacterium]
MNSVKRSLRRLADAALGPVSPLIWRMRQPAPRLLVLMYHRVLPAAHPDRAVEQPGMYVSPETLGMHLAVLKRHFSLVHLDDWLRAASRGEPLPPQACAITFDDGWRDNFDHAFPVLREHAAPATIFLVADLIGSDRVFWPNRLGRVLTRLTPGAQLPGELGQLLLPVTQRMQGGAGPFVEDIDQAIVLAKTLDDDSLNQDLNAAEQQWGAPDDARAVVNAAELALMAQSGLVRFGSHTCTHYRLRGQIPADVLHREIADSSAHIQRMTGQPATLFCYPNGDFTSAAVEMVRQHYLGAVTTKRGWYRQGADACLIPRVGLHEDISNRPAAFLARIA